MVATDHNDNTHEEHGCYGPRNRKLQTITRKIDRIPTSKTEKKKLQKTIGDMLQPPTSKLQTELQQHRGIEQR